MSMKSWMFVEKVQTEVIFGTFQSSFTQKLRVTYLKTTLNTAKCFGKIIVLLQLQAKRLKLVFILRKWSKSCR